MAMIANRAAPLLALAACLALASQADGATRKPNRVSRNLQKQVTATGMKADAKGMQEFYFSKMMTEGDDPVVLLDEGPFKLTASCKTVTYNYSEWEEIYYSPSTTMGTTTTTTTSSYNPSPKGSYSYPSTSSDSHHTDDHLTDDHSDSHWDSYNTDSMDDDWSTDSSHTTDDWVSDGTHTEHIAALELMYTANGTDYLMGMPSWIRYPHEEKLVGAYMDGDSRSQIVFAGMNGEYNSCTLGSVSGGYFTINGDATIGKHKEWDHYLPDHGSFPKGMDCMMMGVVSYKLPYYS